MSKLLAFDQTAKQKLLSGVEQLYKAVSATLGPLGANVVIDTKWDSLSVVHDGVTVAKEIYLEDPFENMGARMVKEASLKTNDTSGDGTTTSTILAYHIIKEFMEKGNPMRLRKQLLAESKVLSEKLKEKSQMVTDITQIATISAQDEEIGKLISEAFAKLGVDGLITVEESKGREMSVNYKKGMEFNKGWASQYFVTNDKMEAEVEAPLILITDKKLSSSNDIVPILEMVHKVTKSVVIIADSIEGEALAILALNKLKGSLNALAVKAPGFSEDKRAMLEDIAIITGGKVITEDIGADLSKVAITDFGRAEKVWSDEETTQIIGGLGKKEEIDKQAEKIRGLIKKATEDYDKEKLQARLAKLTTGAAVISIGARTEMELKEKKERAKDAVAASRAALEEGILPGGASTLIYLCQDGLLKDIVTKPFEVLMANSELEIAPDVLKEFGFGIDVMDGQYKDMRQAGIVDPTKVVREALENAVSVATSILTSRVLITNKPEKETV